MGSVVLEAVNSFFGHNHSEHSGCRERSPRPHEYTPTPPLTATSTKRIRGLSCSEPNHMSDMGQGASSSTAAAAAIITTASPSSTSAPSPSTSNPYARLRDTQQHAHIPQATRPSPQAPSSPVRSTNQSPSLPTAARSASPSQVAISSEAPQTVSPPASSRPRKIKVRDLEHIQSFVSENMGSFSEIRSRGRTRSSGVEDNGTQYEISGMRVEHIIEMIAALLTKIAMTNDRQHEHLHRQPPSLDVASQMNQQTSSVLAFHGKNVPTITILSYLSRISKYCPTSYEVFLSLLVYFDRMTERVNAGPMQTLREANQQAMESRSKNVSFESLGADGMEGITSTTPVGTQQATPPHSGSMEKSVQRGAPGTPHSKPTQPVSPLISPVPTPMNPSNLSHFFVVDSFNIHRLVIAGVTCACKFFSDIFYTNSRYAKVGGLPLPELNHLELQFLQLNDFRLNVPVEEIEAYGTMLVEFYAREVVAKRQAHEAAKQTRREVVAKRQAAEAAMQTRSFSESSSDSTATVQAAG